MDMRFMSPIQHDFRLQVAVELVRYFRAKLLRGGRDLARISRLGHPRQPQRIALVARDHVYVEVKDRLPGGGTAGVEQVHAVGPRRSFARAASR